MEKTLLEFVIVCAISMCLLFLFFRPTKKIVFEKLEFTQKLNADHFFAGIIFFLMLYLAKSFSGIFLPINKFILLMFVITLFIGLMKVVKSVDE